MKKVFEILVPTLMNGKPVRTRHHKEWDKVIRKLSGGMTILTPAKGQWLNKEGRLFEERVIPVKIVCTEGTMHNIMAFTLKHYNQEAVLGYELSNNVFYIERE
jgi:hypothetical protein